MEYEEGVLCCHHKRSKRPFVTMISFVVIFLPMSWVTPPHGHLGHSFRGIYLDSLIIARDGKRKMPNLNFITNRSKFGGGTYIVCGPRLCSSAIKVPKRITRSSSRFKGQYI